MINDPWSPEFKHPFRDLCKAWVGRIDRARDCPHRKAWKSVADHCQAFFASATGFLFDKQNVAKNRFWDTEDGEVNPKFRVTINKAFEMVAVMGPMLYWRNPVRTAVPRELDEIPPHCIAEMMGYDLDALTEVVQMAQQMEESGQPLPYEYQAQLQTYQLVERSIVQQQRWEANEKRHRALRSRLMERVLNWTPTELRLHAEGELVCTDSIIKGRGVYFTEPYKPVGSERTMVGSFRVPPEDLLIDPDATRFTGILDDCWWIARRNLRSIEDEERIRELPPGSLQKFGTKESANMQGASEADKNADWHRKQGETKDLIETWDVWTRRGLGVRDLDKFLMDSDMQDAISLESMVGDYCHFAVARGCPFFLNMPTAYMTQLDEETLPQVVMEAFSWPIPYYRDRRWPCTVLDHYPSNESPYPVPPMGPGLGELIAIQIIISHLLHRIWMTSRDFIVVLESARSAVEDYLREGKDLTLIGLPDIHDDINKVVQFLQQPQVNKDIWTILNSLFNMFEERTGLSEWMQGQRGQESQMRSAEEAANRQANLMIRPDHMSQKVEESQTEIALHEAMCNWFVVRGSDLTDLLGPGGAAMWDTYIAGAEAERVLRDIDYRIEASSARRPNKAQQIANVTQALQYAGQFMFQYGMSYGDFSAWNWLFSRWAKAVDMGEAEGLLLNPPPPQPDPAAQQAQAELELEQQKGELEMRLQQQKAEAEEQRKTREHQLELFQDEEQHDQEMDQSRETHNLDIQMKQRQMQIQLAQAKQQAKIKAEQAKQQAKQKQTSGNGSKK